MVSWFGGGGSSKEDPSEKSFASDDHAELGATAGTSMLGVGGAGGASEFQEFSMGLQQQLMVQTVITDLSDRAFLKCITSCKDSQLSGKEVACIQAATHKWLDTNEYLMGRLQKKQQMASQQQFS